MKKLLCILLLALFSLSASQAQEPIDVPNQYRLENRHDYGVCWWTCAQMIGNKEGISPLQHIVDAVVKTGIGFKHGADQDSIDHWMKELNLKPLLNPKGEKGQAAVDRVQSWLDRGLPVIISYSIGDDSHAVLLTRLGRTKETWVEGNKKVTDYPADFIDPNHPAKTTRRSWDWLFHAWTGRACAFDPREQAVQLVKLPDLRPGRLMLADGVFHPIRDLDLAANTSADKSGYPTPSPLPPPPPPPPPPLPPPAYGLRPLEIRTQAPPYPSYEVPYTIDHPVNYDPNYHIPSNTEIKDGVTRLADIFQNYVPITGHDYYAQYGGGR